MGTDISVSIRYINSSYQYRLFSFTILKTYMYISFSKYIASKLEDFGPEKNFEFLMAVKTFLEIVIVSINSCSFIMHNKVLRVLTFTYL